MTLGEILNLAVFPAYACTLAFASVWGGLPERAGAAAYAVGLILTWTAQIALAKAPLVAFLVVDLATAAAFAVLTFRFPDKLWPGLSGCAQLLVVVFSATRALNFPLSEQSYLVMINVSGLAGFGALAFGTWASRWRPKAPTEWDMAAARLSTTAT